MSIQEWEEVDEDGKRSIKFVNDEGRIILVERAVTEWEKRLAELEARVETALRRQK
jgi:hypothetical protein